MEGWRRGTRGAYGGTPASHSAGWTGELEVLAEGPQPSTAHPEYRVPSEEC